MTDLVPVIQADRDAVQAFHREMARRLMSDVCEGTSLLGKSGGDNDVIHQAFARHRLAAQPVGEPEGWREGLGAVLEHFDGKRRDKDWWETERLVRAALASPPTNGSWRDIASAPKDGTRLIARGCDWGRQDGRIHLAEVVWNADREEWRDAYDPDAACAYLTHWLTSAPASPPTNDEGRSRG
jgi:hypothetical protein